MAGGFFINWAMTEALSLQGNLLKPTCPILCHHHGPLTEPLDQAPHLFFFFSLSHHSLCCPGGSGGGRTLRQMHFWYNQVCFLVKTTKHSDLSSTLWEIPTDLLREGMGRQRFSKIRIWSISQSWSKCLRILNVESKPNYCLEKQTVKLIVCAHLFLILCHPMDCSLPSSSVHGISQARILEWVAISSFKTSSFPRDWTHISTSPALAGEFFYHWATWEAQHCLGLSTTFVYCFFLCQSEK